MKDMLRYQAVMKFVQAALECSVYLAPLDPGLTREELFEAGKREGYEPGEIGDSLQMIAAHPFVGDPRIKPRPKAMWSEFHVIQEPDYRNVAAFDLVSSELGALARQVGIGAALIDRSVLVARANHHGIPENDVEAAITIMLLDSHLLLEKHGAVRFAPGRERYPLASEQLAQAHGRVQRPELERAYLSLTII
jgi:hypothetical protein